MINTLYTINPIVSEHLQDVIAVMRVKGSPTIRVVDCGDYYQALEGSHRIASHQPRYWAFPLTGTSSNKTNW
mgnify:CR=1 FL=1